MGTTQTLTEDARAFFASDELPDRLHWAGWLSPLHLRLFAVELNAALASPTPDPVGLTSLLDSWQATAEMDASPDLQATVAGNRGGKFESADEWLNQHRFA